MQNLEKFSSNMSRVGLTNGLIKIDQIYEVAFSSLNYIPFIFFLEVYYSSPIEFRILYQQHSYQIDPQINSQLFEFQIKFRTFKQKKFLIINILKVDKICDTNFIISIFLNINNALLKSLNFFIKIKNILKKAIFQFNVYLQISINYKNSLINLIQQLMSQPAYKKKLSEYNKLIEDQRANVTRSQSKVISSAQKVNNNPNTNLTKNSPNPNTTGSSYSTPNKNNAASNSTVDSANFILTPPPSTDNKNQGSNQISKPKESLLQPPIATAIIDRRKQQQQEKQKQLLRQKELEAQKQREKQKQKLLSIQIQKERQRQLQSQKQREQQFETFLSSTNRLNSILQQKSKFLEIQYEKQRIYWNDQRLKYRNQIDTLHNQLEEKDDKIRELIEKIAELKQELKAALEKSQMQGKIIVDLRDENAKLKQQNVQIKLENKNLKADNKVVVSHLDKLLHQKCKNSEKTAREIFEERERRVIESLYNKTHSTPSAAHLTQKTQFLPSERNQLSNKVKLEKILQEYQNHRQQSNSMIFKLQQQLAAKQKQCQSYKTKNRILEQSIKKVNELREIERDSTKKQAHIIEQYQRQMRDMSKFNQNLTVQLEKYWRMPIIKQKIGFISKVKKIKEEN